MAERSNDDLCNTVLQFLVPFLKILYDIALYTLKFNTFIIDICICSVQQILIHPFHVLGQRFET